MYQQKDSEEIVKKKIWQEELPQSLGKKLKFYREQKQYTQEELATKISVTRQAVSNWERDKTLPDIYMLQKLSAVFEVTLDEFLEGTKEKDVVLPKTSGYLLAATATTIFLYLIIGSLTDHLVVEIVVEMIIIGVFIQLFLHLYFSNGVKTGNFSMLAGYSSKIEYNRIEVKKVLVQMDLHIACVSFGSVLLLAACAFFKQMETVSIIIILMYCMEFTISIMLYNYRSIDRTLVKDKDKKIAKAGVISQVWFVVWVFLFIGITIAKFELYSIQNNSLESVSYLGWMFLFLLIIMVGFFYEQYRVKKEIEQVRCYRLGKVFWFCNILAITVTILMFYF